MCNFTIVSPNKQQKSTEILNFKFKHGDPFHCQAELNFKALRVFEKHKGSGEFFSFNAVVYAASVK